MSEAVNMAALLVTARETDDEARAIAVLHRSGWRPTEIIAAIDEAMRLARLFMAASAKVAAGATCA